MSSREYHHKEGSQTCPVCGIDLRDTPRIILSLGLRRNRRIYFCSLEHLSQAYQEGILDLEEELFKQWACSKGGESYDPREEI